MIILFFFALFDSFLFPNSYLTIKDFNPAFVFAKDYKLGIGGEERYGLSELKTASFTAQLGNYRVGLKTFGNELYRENLLELDGAIPINKDAGFGLGLGILNCWIRDNSNRLAYSLKLGGVYKSQLAKAWAVLANLNQPRFSEIDYLPILYYLGLNYKVNEPLFFYLNVGGIEDRLPFFNFGIVIIPLKETQICGGINTENFTIEYGLEFSPGRLSFTYAGNSHQQLGSTHSLGITFHL